jgi:Tfp pilus assembly ATPase PilU
MKTFDDALLDLYKDKRISLEETLKNADSRNDLRETLILTSRSNNCFLNSCTDVRIKGVSIYRRKGCA